MNKLNEDNVRKKEYVRIMIPARIPLLDVSLPLYVHFSCYGTDTKVHSCYVTSASNMVQCNATSNLYVNGLISYCIYSV